MKTYKLTVHSDWGGSSAGNIHEHFFYTEAESLQDSIVKFNRSKKSRIDIRPQLKEEIVEVKLADHRVILLP